MPPPTKNIVPKLLPWSVRVNQPLPVRVPLTTRATAIAENAEERAREKKENLGELIYINDPRKIRRTTGQPLKPTERRGGKVSKKLITEIIGYAKKYNIDPNEAVARAIIESEGNPSYNNPFHILLDSEVNPHGSKIMDSYASGVEAGLVFVKQKEDEFNRLVKKGKISPENRDLLRLQIYNGLGKLFPDTEGAKGWMYGVKIPEEGLKMTDNPLYAKELLDIVDIVKANPEIQSIVKSTQPTKITTQYGPLKNKVYVEPKEFGKGGLIKRADGSYSKRGLWDNIRANRGSGKRPTKEMLRQERKIRAAEKKEDGGPVYNWIPPIYPRVGARNEHGGWLDQYEYGGSIEDQRIPTPAQYEFGLKYADNNSPTLTTNQMGTPRAYAHGATVFTKQTTPSWVAGTPTPTSTQREIAFNRSFSPGTAVPYPEVKIPASAYTPASPPVLQGYNPYNGPMRLHAPDTTQIARHGGRVTKKAGIPYAISPGVSNAGMYVGPTTQRGITFANGGWLDTYATGEEETQAGPTVSAAAQLATKPYFSPAIVQSVLAKANQPVTTTTGRVISTPASREKERREKVIAKDPSKYSVEDYKQGIKEPGLEDATLEAIDALSMLSGAGYLGKKGVELGVKEIGKGVKNLIYKGVDPMFYNPTEKIKSFVPNLLGTEKDKIKRVEKIMRDSGVRDSYRKAQNRLDAWRVGLGLPQKYNTFKEIGENTFTINPEFFTLTPQVQQSIIAHAKAFNLKDKYLNNVITSEQYEKGLVNINKKMNDRLGNTFYGRYVKKENIPFQPKAIVERKGDKGFSMYDQDRYAGVMGGFRWDIEDLPDNKIKLIARDTWDLYPFNKRGVTKFSDLTSLERQKELNKGYIPALKNVEMLRLVGGKPYNIENTFIVDKYKHGGWLDSYEEGGEVDPITGVPKPYLNPAMVQATLASADKPITNTLGRVISTPQSREKERREKIIAKDPSKYTIRDYEIGIKEPGAGNSVLDDPLALAAAATAGGVALGAYGLSQVPRMFLGNLASEATAGTSDYLRGLKVLKNLNPKFSRLYLDRLLIARSPKTIKALGQLDPNIANQMILDYNPKKEILSLNDISLDNYTSTIKDLRLKTKRIKREIDKIKKEDPAFSFSSDNYGVVPYINKPEDIRRYYDSVKTMKKTHDSQQKIMTYLNKQYKDRMELINQNPLFKNIAEESPQYTDIIYEHLKNPKTTDNEFVNNLIKQANTFTRAIHKKDVLPDEFFTLRGKSMGFGKRNTIDVEGFPVSSYADEYGPFRYKIEPTSERMSEISQYPIEQRWSKRFPESFSNANSNIATSQGIHTELSPDYAKWYFTRNKRNRSFNTPSIVHNFTEDVPYKYYLYPQHNVFNTDVAGQTLKGFDVSQMNITNQDAHTYLPGFTRGYQTGGIVSFNKYKQGGWLDNL